MELNLPQRWSWVYLVNLVFYLLPLFYQPYPLWQIMLLLAAAVAFVVCYFWAYRCSAPQMLRPILMMLLIAIAMTPFNPGTIALFAFTGFFIGFAYPVRLVVLALALIIAIMAILDYSLQFQGPFFLVYGAVLMSGVTIFGFLERLRQSHQRLQQQSHAEITQLAQMVERERIARDLHDIMGHSLSSIILKADLAVLQLQRQQSDAAAAQLQELAKIARESLSQIRQTVSGYKHRGLFAEVTALVQRLREHGFAVTLTGEVPQLAAREESALILVLTELVTNILRHSQGNSCHISFMEDATGWHCQVADNGQVQQLGFGNGLTGVQERLAALQAKFHYQLDQGCSLHIWLPKGHAE